MIKNLADYFDANQEIYLAEVSYNRIETDKRAEGYLINCTDSITAVSYTHLIYMRHSCPYIRNLGRIPEQKTFPWL